MPPSKPNSVCDKRSHQPCFGFVSHSAELGGAEQCLLDAIDIITDYGGNTVVCLPGQGPLAQALQARGISYISVPYYWWCDLTSRLSMQRLLRHTITGLSIRRMAHFFAASQCNLIISNSAVTYIGGITASVLGIPHVWQLHELKHMWCFDFGERLSAMLMRRTTNRFIVNSETTKESFAPFLRNAPIEVIYPGFDLSQIPQRTDYQPVEPFQSVTIGAIAPHKRHHEAIAAIAHLRSQGIDIRLDIIGAISSTHMNYYRQLQNDVRDKGLQNVIQFRDHVPNTIQHIAQSDLVIVAGQKESFGRVTAEAMLSKTPVIAAAAGASIELLSYPRSGFLYPPGQSDILAELILQIVRDTEDTRKVIDNALQVAVQRFSKERYAETLMQVLTAEARSKDASHG